MTDSPAATSLLVTRPSALPIFVLLSVLGHGLVVGGALIFTWAFAGPRVNLEQKPIKASLVRLGKKRDEKLLPRKEEPLPPPPVKAAEVAVAAPKPPDNAVKVPTRDAKPEKPVDQKKSLFDAFAKTARATPPQELEGDPEGDPNGDSATQEGERYFGLLNSVVKRNYDVSSTIDEAERRRLRAEVAIRIGPAGELLDVNLQKSSGNELFDSAVLGAVKKASPFAPPPPHLRDALKKDGVALLFSP